MTRFDEQGHIRMHQFWAATWAVWLLMLVGILLVGLKTYPGVVAAHAAFFLICEAQGALRKRWGGQEGKKYLLGDTLSEFVWWFLQGEHSRSWIGYAIAVSLGFYIGSLPYVFGSPETWEAIPLWILAAGITGWLCRHFTKFNRLKYAEQVNDPN